MPIVMLTIDYCMNRIPFNLRHLPVSVFVMLMYGIVNIAKTLATGVPVYPPLNFHDVMSYVWSVLLFVLEGLGYLGLYYLTKFKLRKIEEIDYKEHTDLTIYDIANIDKSDNNV